MTLVTYPITAAQNLLDATAPKHLRRYLPAALYAYYLCLSTPNPDAPAIMRGMCAGNSFDTSQRVPCILGILRPIE